MHTTLLSFMLGCASLPALGQADFVKPGEERFTIFLGAFISAFDTKLRVDNSEANQGTNIDAGNDLGVDQHQSSAIVGAEWRIARNHRIGISYARFKLTGDRTASRDLVIGDEIFPAGAAVSSEIKVSFVPITYSYSLLKRDHDELAVTFGLHWSNVSFSVAGSASLNNQDTSDDYSIDGPLPLPLFGLRYDHHLSRRWSAGLRGGVFFMKYSNDKYHVEGNLWNAAGYTEYRFSRHWGVGLAIEAFRIDVEGDYKEWDGKIDYGYWGPQIYLKARF
jgi:hypothetical protein